MFNIAQATRAIRESFEEFYKEGRQEVLNELNSRGYEDIISSVSISPDFEDFEIFFKEDIVLDERQDTIEALAQGGAFKKSDGTYITFKPARSLRKYLSKR